MTRHVDLAYPPRGLARDEAARYVGVGVTLFDEMVADGRMPPPKRINTRLLWDRLALDGAFADLADAGANAWDSALRVVR
jgi:predicted DNA-binding transcriptional regulator AlpA